MHSFTPNTVIESAKINENFTGLADGSETQTDSIGNRQLALGVTVQVRSTVVTAPSTGTTTIPNDDTIPQNTEGDEYMTLSITPKSTTNILIIEVLANISGSVADSRLVGALFQDNTANALAVIETSVGASTILTTLPMRYRMVAGTTSSTTFKLRMGPSSGTLGFNQRSNGATTNYGDLLTSSILITEYKAS